MCMFVYTTSPLGHTKRLWYSTQMTCLSRCFTLVSIVVVCKNAFIVGKLDDTSHVYTS